VRQTPLVFRHFQNCSACGGLSNGEKRPASRPNSERQAVPTGEATGADVEQPGEWPSRASRAGCQQGSKHPVACLECRPGRDSQISQGLRRGQANPDPYASVANSGRRVAGVNAPQPNLPIEKMLQAAAFRPRLG
jgi:hypothetical protein